MGGFSFGTGGLTRQGRLASLIGGDPTGTATQVAASVFGGSEQRSPMMNSTVNARADQEAVVASNQASQDALIAKEKAAADELAQTQTNAANAATAAVTKKKRAIARSNTIYTSPLGIGGTADTARKVLLGA